MIGKCRLIRQLYRLGVCLLWVGVAVRATTVFSFEASMPLICFPAYKNPILD